MFNANLTSGSIFLTWLWLHCHLVSVGHMWNLLFLSTVGAGDAQQHSKCVSGGPSVWIRQLCGDFLTSESPKINYSWHKWHVKNLSAGLFAFTTMTKRARECHLSLSPPSVTPAHRQFGGKCDDMSFIFWVQVALCQTRFHFTTVHYWCKAAPRGHLKATLSLISSNWKSTI